MTESSTSSGPTSQDALIVGIDFGTTYSGVAWANTRDKTIKTIKRWPAEPGQLQKVKTELTYTKSGRIQEWGFQVTEQMPNALRWFKLLLHNADCDLLSYELSNLEEVQREQRLRRLRETLALMPKDKEPKDVAADYLRLLHTQLKAQLQKTYKKDYLNKLGTGKEIPVYYYLTVPAMWSSNAKEMTRAAAREAGMEEWGPVRLLSEPEAAAAHCFMEYQGTKDALEVDDVFVIVDCGGGTVDIISYEVTSISPLKVKEIAVGKGGLYGSVFLNDRFEDLVRSKIGASAFDMMSPQDKEEMVGYFETRLKRTFCENKPANTERWPTDDSNDGDTECDSQDEDDDDLESHEETFPVPVPGVPDFCNGANVIAESLRLTASEVKLIFEPIFRGIKGMVQSQVDEAEENSRKPVTALMLVGGFGSSDYLYEYLSANIKSRLKPEGISVLQVPEGWQAIVQGAVQHGLSIHQLRASNGAAAAEADSAFVEIRRVRESYGFSVSQTYKPGIHPKDQVDFCPVVGGLICKGRMQWLIERGAELKGKTMSDTICTIVPAGASDPEEMTGEIKILSSAALVAPKGEEDDSVQPFTEFSIDLSGVSRKPHMSLMHLCLGLDLELERIPYNLYMKVTEAAEVEFSAEADGKVLGQSAKLKPKVDE